MSLSFLCVKILVSAVEFKDPTTLLMVSIFLGSLGIDRFMLGETGMGILMLLTLGLCGILTIIDWFSVQRSRRPAAGSTPWST